MKLFIDTADIEEIKKGFALGVLDGVTTNPSLIKKAKEKYAVADMKTYIENILLASGDTPVSLEVAGGNAKEMYAQARALYDTFKTAKNTVVIKIPINPSVVEQNGDGLSVEGLKVIKRLSSEGIPTNVTLIFTPEQAVMAAKAGATYVSPFVGREDDYIRSQTGGDFDKSSYYACEESDVDGKACPDDNGIHSGCELVAEIVSIFELYGYETQVLAASLRNTRQVRDAMLVGADVATVPLDVISDLVAHPKTLEGMQKFSSDLVEEYTELLK